MKMAGVGPVHGTNIGIMQARKTNSSVNCASASTWFLNHRKSFTYSKIENLLSHEDLIIKLWWKVMNNYIQNYEIIFNIQ